MIDQALELAGVRSGRRALDRRPVEVSELFEQAINDHRHTIEGAGLDVAVDIEPGLGRISGDFDALRRVIDNLLGNAIKYGGNRIRLSARSAGGAHRLAKDRDRGQDAGTAGGSIVLEIADIGPGIDDADRQHLFEPFYRGALAREGTTPGSGLGLHLARELVTRMGGEISALARQETMPRQAGRHGSGGAVFQIVLPAAESRS
jgi:signal transduction histidine kinase